ncbi:NO-inducible flavohemoprotein [Erwinia tracheiphila]|uniref:nitric oxide dioxygenase n=1 Tax=Erwinia tracheiphila TaxID=65700 RepID=A0A0M2KAD3_9GAMM|nr:NO-inducible flavohemoprotein [Erwinia tracheiphila]EOS94361.1 bifunctional nitric oxide dioxygenase/dihydropteridine reductase 2 [Erwinia tracheiphila PSU-1]KKF34237.1 dihydropteridine reductase [Erwinia tracheiphila]UIA89264.1 NO-inducible flavohemoprotein [Erwinia tracheiphila]UIA97647.1 NO-inducible flavohemoprotein [Erwinia tracheiphila]
MLDPHTISTIKSTIPALLATGSSLTAYFYDRMFTHNPELKNIFNMSNQHNGKQREALFNTLCACATHIENLSVLQPVIEKIAQKHASLAIQPNDYEIVGKHLLATLEEKLSPGTTVLTAWGEAYRILASLFITREEEIYRESEGKPGGWRGLRSFYISKIDTQSEKIKSFILTPTDGLPVADYCAGQYLSVWLRTASGQQIRQYSLTQSPNGKDYRIAVRHADNGKVSGWLHQQAKTGDELLLTPPAGDFFLDVQTDTAIALISAGAGQTPMLSMLDVLVRQQHPKTIWWFHATDNGRQHAFDKEVTEKGAGLATFSQCIWYNSPLPQDNDRYHREGLMELMPYRHEISDPDMQFYLCGPTGFMQSVTQQLMATGISRQRIHYETFGPHQVI